MRQSSTFIFLETPLRRLSFELFALWACAQLWSCSLPASSPWVLLWTDKQFLSVIQVGLLGSPKHSDSWSCWWDCFSLRKLTSSHLCPSYSENCVIGHLARRPRSGWQNDAPLQRCLHPHFPNPRSCEVPSRGVRCRWNSVGCSAEPWEGMQPGHLT